MRVSTKTKVVTLDKRESDRLKQTRDIILGLVKHADGALQEQSVKASVEYEKMLLAIGTQELKQKELALGAGK